MKLRITVVSHYEREIEGDDFDAAVKEIWPDAAGVMQKDKLVDQRVDCVDEVSERV